MLYAGAVDHAHPVCPRCGYDLSGAAAAWERGASCPLDGVCSECGLGFAWRDILNPAYAEQQRLFEHARRRVWSCLLLTAWRALRPRSFWVWVRMEHPIRWRRLAVGAIGGMLIVHAAAAGLAMGLWLTADAYYRFVAPPDPPIQRQVRLSLSRPTGRFAQALWPVRRGARGEMSAEDLYSSWAAVSVLIVVLMPIAFLALPHTLRRAKARRAHLLRIAAYSIIALPLVLALPGVIDAMVQFGDSAGFIPGGSRIARLNRFLYSRGKLWVFVTVLAWLWVWWCFASRRYLRLPQPYIAATAAAMVAGSAAFTAGLMLPGLAIQMWRPW